MNQYDVLSEGKINFVINVEGYRVFYNHLAKPTRTLGVAFVFGESLFKGRHLVVADVLAATGVRGIRYCIESGGVSEILFNDKSKLAYRAIAQNVALNNIKDISRVTRMDANKFLFLNSYKLDFIDIDPYGTPAPFLDASISTVRNNGMVAITATDLAPLCGIYKRPTLRKYGSLSIHTEYCHEVAVRILTKSLVEAAGRHTRYIMTISGHFINQYARVYVRVIEGKRGYPHENIGYILHCTDHNYIGYCRSDKLLEYAEDHTKCKGLMVAGPLWIGPLHDINFINRVHEKIDDANLVERDRKFLHKMLSLFRDEADMPPYHYDLHEASKRLCRSVPKIERVLNELNSIGYRSVKTHFKGTAIKTEADYNEFLDVLRGL